MTTKILVLASNPQGTAQLRLNPEIREIEDAIERGKNREKFVLRSKVAVRVEDLQRSIRQEAAKIVHFCGHGTGSQGLVLETTSGQQQLLDTQAIADLFKLFANQVECVVLNACYSQVQAAEINQHINYVIGTKKEIKDNAAIAFSQGFYEALGDGETIERAYQFGCNRIQIAIYGSSNRERKLVPVYSEAESKWVELPQNEVIELQIKEPLNTIVNSSASLIADREVIIQRPFIARSPYKGLKRFNAVDKDLFFGRERLTNKLIEAVNQSNLVLVLGASGSGKSSVVRAGVMPQIEGLSETPYQICLFTPNRDPFVSFHRSLLDPTKDIFSESEVEFVLEGKNDTLSKTTHLLKSKHPQWLIFIDQFEELFTICSNPETRSNFIRGIIRIAQATDQSVKLLLAMRSDFLEELSAYRQFARIAQNNIHLVADMQVEELRQAIEQPAAKHGIVFESGLVEEIIQDVQGQAGSLPLLQYTLDLLWQDDDLSDRTLNIVTYRQLGGVTGALQKHVKQIYQGLSFVQQLATKQILLRLVDVIASEQSEVLKTTISRRAYKSEFTEIQEETVNLLIDKSLLVSDDVDREGQSTVEIAHEALLTSWVELKDWITDARNTISLNNRLAEDANRWQELRKENQQQANEELWSGSKLEKVIELRKDGTFEVVLGGLGDLANEFIDASIDQHDRQIQEKLAAAQKLAEADRKARIEAEKAREEAEARRSAEQQAREAAEAAREEAENARQFQENARKVAEEKATLEADTNKKLRQRAWWLGILSSVAVMFGISALSLSLKSQEAAQKAQLKQQAASIKAKLSLSQEIGHLLESIQLAGNNQHFNQRWFKSKTKLVPEAQSVLYQAIEESRESSLFSHESWVDSVAFSLDGQYLVSDSTDKMVKLWDVEQQFLMHNFNGSTDKKVKFWGVEQQSLIHTFNGHQSWVNSVAFSLDGQYLVSGSTDKTVKLWDVEQQSLIHTFNGHQSLVTSVAFSLDGQYLVSGSRDKTVKLWDVEQQSLIHTFDGHQSSVNSVAFSPYGQYLISASTDKTVKLWDVKQKSLIHTFDGHQDTVNSATFSPDSQYLVSGSTDKTVKLWDVEQQSLIHTFDGHQSLVTSVAFSLDGQYLVSGSRDKTVKLWDVEQQTLIHTFNGHQSSVTSVAISPDGQYLISASTDKTVKLWRGTDWQDWLAVGCQKLRLNPELVSRETDSAPEAVNICLEYGRWSNLEKAEVLVKQGLALAAAEGDVDRAKKKFQQAYRLDSTNVNLAELETEAKHLTAQTLIDKGIQKVRQGNVTEALSLYEQAQNLDPHAEIEIDAKSLNILCWFGSIYGYAEKVFFACEQAIVLAADEENKVPPHYLDSRGLARALTGDTQGAIDDFQAYVDSSGFTEESRNQRKQWLELLKKGENPFTDEILEDLKN